MFYELAIKVNRIQDSGKEKEVVERYITDCELFSEAEVKGMDLLSQDQAEGDVIAIKRSNVYEIVNESKTYEEKMFKVKLVKTFFEDSGKEKELQYHVLLWATDMNDANIKAQNYLKQGLEDMKIVGIKETNLLSII